MGGDHLYAIWLHWYYLATLGRCGGKCVPTVIKSHIERPPPIHVLLELGCEPRIASDTKETFDI